MKTINRIILLLATMSVAYLTTTISNFDTVIIYFLLISIGSLIILFISDLVLPVFQMNVLLTVWRLISSTFALALILSVYIANGDNCNYACGYPILYVTMANGIFAGVTLVFLIIQLLKKRKTKLIIQD